MPYAETTTSARLYYEERGAGEPLLLLHGLLGTAALHFPRVMDWLEADYHLYGLTLRGYGQSTPKPRDFPLRFYHRDAEDVLAFLDAAGLDKVHVLGYSDGGEVALVAAGLQPERFQSVAVIGAVGNFSPEIRPVVQRMFPATWITAEDKQNHGFEDADAFILPWINAMKSYIDQGGDISLSTADRITAPVLIMLGETDTLNPVSYAETFVQRTSHGQVRMFSCGHPVHDDAWESFQQVYGDFLRAAAG
jgi:valacyclovir hydrolase